jgi:ABC-type transport system involved in cytochrome bd biosynthesis fused ATPase/permease subunit
MKERLDYGQLVLIIATFAFMAFLIKYGPADQRGTVYAAAVGLLTLVVAAVRGRLLKRRPEEVVAKAAHKAGEKAEKAVVEAVDDIDVEPPSKPETD